MHRPKALQARRSRARRPTSSRRPRRPSARSSPPLRRFGPGARREEDPGSASLPIGTSGDWPGGRFRQTGPCAFRCLPLPSAVARPALRTRWPLPVWADGSASRGSAPAATCAARRPHARFIPRAPSRPIPRRTRHSLLLPTGTPRRRRSRHSYQAQAAKAGTRPATRRLRPIGRTDPLAPARADVYSANRPDVNTGAGIFPPRPPGHSNPRFCGSPRLDRVALSQHRGDHSPKRLCREAQAKLPDSRRVAGRIDHQDQLRPPERPTPLPPPDLYAPSKCRRAFSPTPIEPPKPISIHVADSGPAIFFPSTSIS